MDQVAKDGIGKLAIRSVAAALGLAPNALYRYFANLPALQAALAEESRRRLHEVLHKAAGKSSPKRRSKASHEPTCGLRESSLRCSPLR